MPTGPRTLPIWSQAGVRSVERPVERRGKRPPGGRPEDRDLVVAEEPLEIRIAGESLMVTMRTPGDDLNLAAGLLYTEGVIASLDEVASLTQGGTAAGRNRENVVDVTVAAGHELKASAARRVLRATAACGLCGKESIADVRRRIPAITDPTTVPLDVVLGLPETIRAAQPVFSETGGLHAVGLFTPEGAPLMIREDVGRHNAVDKVIGARLRGWLSLAGGRGDAALRPRRLRAGSKGGRRAGPDRLLRLGSLRAGRRSGRGGGDDAGGLRARRLGERLHPSAPGHLTASPGTGAEEVVHQKAPFLSEKSDWRGFICFRRQQPDDRIRVAG